MTIEMELWKDLTFNSDLNKEDYEKEFEELQYRLECVKSISNANKEIDRISFGIELMKRTMCVSYYSIGKIPFRIKKGAEANGEKRLDEEFRQLFQMTELIYKTIYSKIYADRDKYGAELTKLIFDIFEDCMLVRAEILKNVASITKHLSKK